MLRGFWRYLMGLLQNDIETFRILFGRNKEADIHKRIAKIVLERRKQPQLFEWDD